MMRILISALLVVSFSCSGQSFRDTIFLKNEKVIPCFIDGVNDTTNRITFFNDIGINRAAISKDDVEMFVWNGRKYDGSVSWIRLKCADWPFIEQISPYKYEKVCASTGITANKLYSIFQLWIAESFHDGEEVTKLNDPINHTLLVKGNTEICLPGMWGYWSCDHRLWFSLKIQCKNERYKYEVTDIRIAEVGGTEITTGMLNSSGYFSSKKRTKGEAEPRYYAACSEISDFNKMIDMSLRIAIADYQKEDDW